MSKFQQYQFQTIDQLLTGIQSKEMSSHRKRRIDDDEYQLSDLISLREQIINGDYRCLMMAWLKIAQEDVAMVNQYAADGLKMLNRSLKQFAPLPFSAQEQRKKQLSG